MAKGKSPSPAKPVQTNAGPNPMGTPAKTVSTAGNLKQALRIAGSDGNIGNKELQKITSNFDVDSSKAIRQLDQLNAGLKERGKDLQIGLGSNAVNNLIKTGNTYTSGIFRESQLGTGNIGSTLQNYINASNPTGGYQNPQSGASSYKPVRNDRDRAVAQSTAGLIPLQRGGDYQINPTGGYSPKVSNPAFNNLVPKAPTQEQKFGLGGENGPPRIPGNLGSTGTTDTGTTDTGTTGPGEGGPMTPQQMAEASSLAMGADINSSTLGYRRRPSSRSRNRSAQGIAGATRVNPFGAWKGSKG